MLTIGIPTYNRQVKLERLLRAIERQLDEPAVRGRVRLLVSDNASDDGTCELLERMRREWPDFPLAFHRQPINVGAVRNIVWLYEHAPTEYLWLFADDDLPLPGAVARVLSVLDAHTPRVLISSFIQPPGSSWRVFDFPEPVRLLDDPEEAARLLTRGAKLSVFVYQRVPITPSSQAFLKATVDEGKGGYIHCVIAVSLLEASENARLAVLSEPLATCDEDYRVIRAPVSEWGHLGHVGGHPYLLGRAPGLASELSPRTCYVAEISMLWAWRAGCIEVDASCRDEYQQAVRRLPLRLGWLVRDVPMLIRAIALRFLPGGTARAIHFLAQMLNSATPEDQR